MEIDELIYKAQKARFENSNLKLAEELFLKAANLGSGHAAHELGVLYMIGGEGIEISPEKSRYWLEISLESGFEETISSDPEWFKK